MAEKIEILNAPGLFELVDDLVAEMTNRGLAEPGTELPMTLVLKTTGEITADGSRVMSGWAYLDMSDNRIINDMEGW